MLGTSLGAPVAATDVARAKSLPTTSIVPPAARAWLAVAALGAALLHAALAASAPLPALIVLLAIGAAELAWAAATLARDQPPALKASLFLALVPVGAWAAIATVGATTEAGTVLALPPLPLGVASLLDVAISLTVAVLLRRNRPAPQNTGAGRFVLSLALSAAVVCGVTIPALGVTDAGVAAVDVHLQHGGHH
ncbi:hypothetical protein ACFVWR_08010 [Leifsonia sp. NPDC058292]|uniref:hypothetical protein n=1 Tax=Leifsonia sp. NPDC058292 TaxID=3346428 RepID=UPI0036DA746D